MPRSTPELAETGSHSIGPRLTLAIVLLGVGSIILWFVWAMGRNGDQR